MCDIGDASKGSLSSYAYILMLLHYLQQCNPPVIPVLQNLYTDNKKPEKIIDGWNCWFCKDPNEIVCVHALWLFHLLGCSKFAVQMQHLRERVAKINPSLKSNRSVSIYSTEIRYDCLVSLKVTIDTMSHFGGWL